MTKRFGFTLAEVLITLGIIGVVAAMTIPTLVKNYQKTAWVNQLKKSVSTIENGFSKMLADDGVDSLEDTQVFRSLNASSCTLTKQGDCGEQFENKLKEYFKIIEIPSSSTSIALTLSLPILSSLSTVRIISPDFSPRPSIS